MVELLSFSALQKQQLEVLLNLCVYHESKNLLDIVEILLLFVYANYLSLSLSLLTATKIFSDKILIKSSCLPCDF